jgi:hypothetical protein
MDARTVVKADALFEAALGLALVVGAATGELGAGDFPHPVGTAAVAVIGFILLPVATVLWRGAVPLTALASANAATALIVLIWLLAASGFSGAGTSVLVVTVVGLSCLAAAQVAAHRRFAASRSSEPTC